MPIGGLFCQDVKLTHVADFLHVGSSPGKAIVAKFDHQDIGHQPRMSTGAIYKWVNLHQAVMEAQRNLVDKFFAKQDPPSAKCPQLTPQNVFLIGCVEIIAIGEVSRYEIAYFFGC